jgi:hypothetical protein
MERLSGGVLNERFIFKSGEQGLSPKALWVIINVNNTRQGYARKRILKPAGYFFGAIA